MADSLNPLTQPDPELQRALSSINPDMPAVGRLSPEELSSLMERGSGRADFDLTQEVPSSVMPGAPPAIHEPQQQTIPQTQQNISQQAPPPVDQNQNAMWQRMHQLETQAQEWGQERQQLMSQANRMDQMDRYFSEHPEALERMFEAPAPRPDQDPVVTEVMRLRRQNDAMAQEVKSAKRMSELAVEAQQLYAQWGNAINFPKLAEYASNLGLQDHPRALTVAWENVMGRMAGQTILAQKQHAQQGQNYGSPSMQAPPPQYHQPR
jgi:hypothetical protein